MQDFLTTAFEGLNPAQREAAETLYGPLVVIAGPGTGKTQIVAARAANILKKTDARPENLLITTFTEAGVVSIKKRLLKFLGTDSYRVTVSTIHAFANDVIRLFPEKFLRFRAMRPVDEVEQIALIEEIVESAKYEFLSSDHDRLFYVSTIRDRIGKLKQEAVSPQSLDSATEALSAEYAEILSDIKPTLKKYETERKRQETHIGKLRDLSHAYRTYLSACYERGLYDFSDMIEYVGRVLEEDADLRATLAERYQFVMLDEFQDMSGAQNRVIDAMLSEAETPNVMAVGDDDQSIYRFQGASLENLFHFSKRYPGTKFVVLEDNYRSTDAILRLAEKGISSNTERIGAYIPSIVKKLRSNRPNVGIVRTTAYVSPLEEKAAVLAKVRRRIRDGVPPEEIAVLCRTNREASEWAAFFVSNDVPARSKNLGNALENPFVSLALDLIEVATDPFVSEERVVRILRSDLFSIPGADVLKLNRALARMNYVRKDRFKLLDAVGNAELLLDFGIADPKPFSDFHSVITDAGPRNESLYEDVKTLLDAAAFVGHVERQGGFSDLEALFTLLETVREWSSKEAGITVAGFLRKIGYYRKYALILPVRAIGETPGCVQCLTAHQSKGLEYEAVFMTGLHEGNWGGRRNADLLKLPATAALLDGSAEIAAKREDRKSSDDEEERRLFFVGMTRAKSDLMLSYSETDGTKERVASVFLTELNMPQERNDEELDYAEIISAEAKPAFTLRRDLTAEEEAYVADFLSTYRLSPSDLSKFCEDPGLFLRDTVFKYPFEDNEYTIFGKSYHRALELFYLEWKKSRTQPSPERLVADFERALAGEILPHDTKEKLLKKGREGLVGWHAAHSGAFGVPLELEYNFYPRNIVFEGIPLTGKIDKIELMPGGGVRLLDYKTGRIRSENDIKGQTANSDGKYFRQLLFYKLLFELDPTLSSKYAVESLAVEFVEGKDGEYRSVDVSFSNEDEDRVKNEIRDAWTKIRDPEFWRKTLAKARD